ncbi:E3 ubiquitin-protein ligase RFWD2-like [Limulus polyphemus]|uniref:E3 ubiquitin-protein ligase RFWD2-like n=1 Tax=Limulus polyphemus TaxID=6850 RepID=A0ABM1T791_LIMPO|nr:E3 ubiquitin-protein ligase RFWD2-like [Limulus polyphemus]
MFSLICFCLHFSFKCIRRALEQSNRCPKCNFVIEKKDQIFPNFLLNELITKHQQKMAEKKLKLDTTEMIQDHQLVYQRKSLSLFSGHLSVACSANDETQAISVDNTGCASLSGLQDGFNGSRYGSKQHWLPTTVAARRKRMNVHFEDLQQCYFSSRSKEIHLNSSATQLQLLKEFLEQIRKQKKDELDQISKEIDVIDKDTKHVEKAQGVSKLQEFLAQEGDKLNLADVNYMLEMLSQKKQHIEFDKDNEFFAIAGVTKKIKVFDYGTAIMDTIDMHYPVNKMVCNSEISCISWSSYHKGMLASSDYEGTVTIWDAFTGQKIRNFQEHEKRCWSVDFNRVDTKLVASGSDDSRVKLWSTGMDHSVTSLETKANVCCVKFNPESRYHLAFGSADHSVHYYDLRNIKQPLGTFRGHKKAVSYVKFLNTEEIVSASTDSQLKLWNINKPHCLRSFKGHINEKNFVGLATDGDYVACGSENNSLYIYYKGMSKQVLTFKFDTVRSVLEKDKKDEETNEFVSAVCWRMGTNVVVAANSQGTIKVLELV